jgi:hypothetical protein
MSLNVSQIRGVPVGRPREIFDELRVFARDNDNLTRDVLSDLTLQFPVLTIRGHNQR